MIVDNDVKNAVVTRNEIHMAVAWLAQAPLLDVRDQMSHDIS